jgi:cytochrome c oxidase assembly protein subunit 15
VPDFPLAEQVKPISEFQIGLQMAHRLVALSIVLLVGAVAWRARRGNGADSRLAKLALSWWSVICIQVTLGAATVWSNKAADIATAHVLVGALSLMTGAILSGALLVNPQCKSPQSRY